MTKILRVSFSPRGALSESFRLSQEIVAHLLAKHPHADLVDREFGLSDITAIDAEYAMSQGGPIDVSERGTMRQSEGFIMELVEADFLVISTPMHNLTVPASLKTWIDHVVRVRRTFDITPAGKVGTLADRPVLIAIAAGGRFSGDHPNQPDFLTPYLRFILGMIGLQDLTFFSVQGTGSSPDVLAAARVKTTDELKAHFLLFDPKTPDRKSSETEILG